MWTPSQNGKRKGAGPDQGQGRWPLSLHNAFCNSEESKNTKFTNSGLLVFYEDVFVKVKRYYIFYSVHLISSRFITSKYLHIQYMNLHLSFLSLALQMLEWVCLCPLLHLFSLFLLVFPFQPVFFSPPSHIIGICWVLVLTFRTGGVAVYLSASLPVL